MLNLNLKVAKNKQAPHQNGKAGMLKRNGKRKATSPAATTKPNTSAAAADNSQAKKIKLKKELHKVANVDEINQLQASEKLYHSNFFHLQMEELLKVIRVSEKRRSFVDLWLESLTKFLTSLDSDEERHVPSDLKWLRKKDVYVPIGDAIPFDETLKYFFQFLAPNSVFPIGALRTSTVIDATDLVLDVCMEIPHEFFHKTNHLNGVYHRKRALYLSYVALQLSKWDQVAECKFTLVQNDQLQVGVSTISIIHKISGFKFCNFLAGNFDSSNRKIWKTFDHQFACRLRRREFQNRTFCTGKIEREAAGRPRKWRDAEK